MASGIYCIRNTVSGRAYVGSSKDIKQRWAEHRKDLVRGNHCSAAMQRSWLKHGPEAFDFLVLEEVPAERAKLIAREQYWIDTLSAFDKTLGFNMSPTAGSPLGCKQTLEARAAKSAALKGKPKSPEHIAAVTAALRARTRGPLSPKQRAHLAALHASQKGKSLCPDHRAAVSAGQRGKPRLAARGKPLSPEHRAAVSAGKMGKRPSPEHCAAISAAKKGKPNLAAMGKPHTAERRAAISAAKKGKRQSPQHRAAIAAGRLLAKEKRALKLQPGRPTDAGS